MKMNLRYVIVGFLLGTAVLRCGVPPIGELLPKKGIDCKAEIVTDAQHIVTNSKSYVSARIPVPQGATTVEVKVRIFDCKEAQ